MNKKTAGSVFKDLIAEFRDMDRADFLAGVGASLGYDGDYVSWQSEAENAIEPLEKMAWHGDEMAFNSLLYLGSKVAQILENFAQIASQENSEKIKEPFRLLIPDRKEDADIASTVTTEDLKALASLPREKLQETITKLESEFPDVQTTFSPECLLKISRNASTGLPVNFNDSVNLPDSEFGSLMQLMGKLAAIRARSECIRMVRKKMAHAEVWPLALPSIRELRTANLKEFEKLAIGSDLTFSVNPPQGRGKALGFARNGGTTFAYRIYLKLERERTYPRNPVHLDSISESYGAYLRQIHDDSLKADTPGNSDDFRMITAPEAKPWNKLNEWKAEAALLEPLSANVIVLESWTNAGIKFIEADSELLTQYKLLPESLVNRATDSNDMPSPKRIENVVRTALKEGLNSIASRINLVDPRDENVMD